MLPSKQEAVVISLRIGKQFIVLGVDIAITEAEDTIKKRNKLATPTIPSLQSPDHSGRE